MTLAEYRCGCTWMGQAGECLEYCARHGSDRIRKHRVKLVPKSEQGWDWEDPQTQNGPEDLSPGPSLNPQ